MHWDMTSLGLVTSTAVQNANMYLKVFSRKDMDWMQSWASRADDWPLEDIRPVDVLFGKGRRVTLTMFISFAFR